MAIFQNWQLQLLFAEYVLIFSFAIDFLLFFFAGWRKGTCADLIVTFMFFLGLSIHFTFVS